jgi:hypothetical protein
MLLLIQNISIYNLCTKEKVPEFFKYSITKSLLVMQMEPHDVGTTGAKEL